MKQGLGCVCVGGGVCARACVFNVNSLFAFKAEVLSTAFWVEKKGNGAFNYL